MNILIKQAKIIGESSPYHHKIMDVMVEGGMVTEIKKAISPRGNVKVIEGEDLHISAGWVDMQVAGCDPGLEHKENLDTLVRAAAAGGFTAVCVHNYNQPALHSKTQIEYIVNKTEGKVVQVLPVGTITMEAKGKDMAEMYDMKLSGAKAFSDHKHAVKDSGVVLRALQYGANIDTLIITHCSDESIGHGGQMNEGETAVMLGLKGIPALAEELMMQRNLAILEYTGGRLHIPTVSTRGGVELIKRAKAAGLRVTAGVAAVNLRLDDSVLAGFDTNYKVEPPLRTKKDVQALCSALINGTLDVVVSDHLPQDTESKELEFDLAENGIINLQTAFHCVLEGLKEKHLDALVRVLTENPRAIMGLAPVRIEENQPANLTIFSPSQDFVFTERVNQSRSKNSPFLGETLKGRVIGVINAGKTYFN